jgi:hypothetical protein
MVLTKPNHRDKPTRGKPFEKGNQYHKKRKSQGKNMDDTGCESSVEGGVVTSNPQPSSIEALETENSPLQSLHELVVDTTNQILSETLSDKKVVIDDGKGSKLVDSLDFFNGENKLSIRFSKCQNRMFRIQIFLNDEIEIRPVTYTGARTGESFWELLKGNLKK